MIGRALALAALAVGCARASEPTPPRAPEHEPPRTLDLPRGPQGLSRNSSATDAAVAEALALVASVRELEVRAQVPGLRLDRAALRVAVEQMLTDEVPEELVTGNTELLFALDLVSADFDFKKTLGVLYGAQLAGYYDPDKKQMVLATDLDPAAERLTLYHELVHALQDQHYDLGEALDWKPERSDALAALQCLGEGDATSAMLEVFARWQGGTARQPPAELLRLDSLLMQLSPDVAGTPGIISRSLVAPYADGLTFVNVLRQKFGGFGGVDQAWRDPPVSTEQILHPEKYLAHEPVISVPDIAPPPGFVGGGFRDVVGEQSLRLVFEDWMPAGRAAESAADWGGDRLAVFSAGERRVVRWHLVFDTEAASQRAVVALARGALRAELPAAPATGPDTRPFVEIEQARAQVRGGKLCRERAQRGAFAIVRRGSHIGVTLGPFSRREALSPATNHCPDALRWAENLSQSR